MSQDEYLRITGRRPVPGFGPGAPWAEQLRQYRELVALQPANREARADDLLTVYRADLAFMVEWIEARMREYCECEFPQSAGLCCRCQKWVR